MRSDSRPRPSFSLRFSLTVWLMISLVVAFILQQIDINDYQSAHLRYLVLNVEDLRRGWIWELLTFQFLHAGLAHLAFNMFSLWCFGRMVEERLGNARFLQLYFLSGVAGGLLQCIMAWIFPAQFGGGVVGASAGIVGLIAAFALLEPGATIMMSFVLPIPAKHLLYIEFAISLIFTILPSKSHVAHAAHLGGILFAVAYLKWGLDATRNLSEWNPLQRKMRREKMIKAATVRPAVTGLRRRPRVEDAQELPSAEFISQEVDPILDKISAHGIQSLTERERQILQAARAKMSKR